jgi:hypothetical protein
MALKHEKLRGEYDQPSQGTGLFSECHALGTLKLTDVYR